MDDTKPLSVGPRSGKRAEYPAKRSKMAPESTGERTWILGHLTIRTILGAF